MNNLDKFFKNKLDDRQVPFQDAFWEEALTMLDERDKRKRKGTLWWWLGGSIFVVVLALGIYCALNGRSEVESAKADEAIDTFTIAETTSQRNIADPNSTNPEKRINEMDVKQKLKEIITPDIESSHQQKTATKDEQINIEGSLTKVINDQENNPIKTDVNSKDHTRDLSLDQSQEIERSISNMEQYLPEQRKVVANKLLTDTITSSSSVVDHPLTKTISEREEAEKTVEDKRIAMSILFPVPVKSSLVVYEESSPTLSKEERESVVEVSQAKKTQWSLGLGAMLNPSDGKRLLGTNTGLMMAYPLNKKMKLYARTAYRRQGGTFGSIQESRQIDFRFGASEERFSLRPARLHYINASAGILRRWQKHQLGIGLSYQYLLGIKGEVTSTAKGEFVTTFSSPVVIQNGWLDEKGFFKNMLGAELFYQFQLQKRIGLELKLNYWPSTILNDDVSIPKEVRLQEYGPIFIDFGINYHL